MHSKGAGDVVVVVAGAVVVVVGGSSKGSIADHHHLLRVGGRSDLGSDGRPSEGHRLSSNPSSCEPSPEAHAQQDEEEHREEVHTLTP